MDSFLKGFTKAAGPLGQGINKVIQNPTLRANARKAMLPLAKAERASKNVTRRAAAAAPTNVVPMKAKKHVEGMQLRAAEKLKTMGHNDNAALEKAMDMGEEDLHQFLGMKHEPHKKVKNPWTGSSGAVEHVKAAFMVGFEKAALSMRVHSKDRAESTAKGARAGALGFGAGGLVGGALDGFHNNSGSVKHKLLNAAALGAIGGASGLVSGGVLGAGYGAAMHKKAYNYNQEARELKGKYLSKSKESPADPTHSATFGGITGGITGAAYGGMMARGSLSGLAGAGIGGVAGAAIGIMLGLAAASGHKASIEEAKKIIKMAPKKQMDLLKSEARSNETHDNMHEQARLNADYHARRQERGY